MMESKNQPVIYFDGQCNLCNGFILYVIKRDPDAKFRFAPLQSDKAQKHADASVDPEGTFETILLEQNGTVYKYSDAVLNIFAQLSGISKFLAVFKIIPKPVRDWIYRWIAGKRYWIFGKTDRCMLPTPEIMGRFL